MIDWGIWIDMIFPAQIEQQSVRSARSRMSAVGWGGPENTAGNWAMRRRWLRITDLWHRNTPSICMAATGPSWPMSVWSCSKTMRCAVKVVWVYRQTQWVAFFSTDMSLSVRQIVEYYGARWKIEALFKELKNATSAVPKRKPVIRRRSATTCTFCMLATTVAWIYASRAEKTPTRRHAVDGRSHFAFSGRFADR